MYNNKRTVEKYSADETSEGRDIENDRARKNRKTKPPQKAKTQQVWSNITGIAFLTISHDPKTQPKPSNVLNASAA